MGDDWRVCTARGDPRDMISDTALTRALSRRFGYQLGVGWYNGQVFWYAPSARWADEIAQAAREILAHHDVGRHQRASFRTERWSRLDQEWRDVTDVPSAVIDAELQAEHEYFQEQERERSRRAGFPAWHVRVDMPSHSDVVALAGHLAAQGWGVRRRRRHLIVGANCEDDAKVLVRVLSGDGHADAETAFRVRRVSYKYILPDGSSLDNGG